MARTIARALVAVTLLAAAPAAVAQRPPASAPGAEREQAYVEALRREDPEAADRYVALRDAQNLAIADLERAQTRYNAGGPALRPVALPQLKQAQRKYAETSLALLDFLDARDQRAITSLQEQIERVRHAREERARARADLEKLLHLE